MTPEELHKFLWDSLRLQCCTKKLEAYRIVMVQEDDVKAVAHRLYERLRVGPTKTNEKNKENIIEYIGILRQVSQIDLISAFSDLTVTQIENELQSLQKAGLIEFHKEAKVWTLTNEGVEFYKRLQAGEEANWICGSVLHER